LLGVKVEILRPPSELGFRISNRGNWNELRRSGKSHIAEITAGKEAGKRLLRGAGAWLTPSIGMAKSQTSGRRDKPPFNQEERWQ